MWGRTANHIPPLVVVEYLPGRVDSSSWMFWKVVMSTPRVASWVKKEVVREAKALRREAWRGEEGDGGSWRRVIPGQVGVHSMREGMGLGVRNAGGA